MNSLDEKIIIALKVFEEMLLAIEETPNDAELGKKIRNLYHGIGNKIES